MGTSLLSTQPSSPAVAASARLGLASLGAMLVAGSAFIIYRTDPLRSEALVSVLCEFVTCLLLVGVAMVRSPGAVLRMSDPYLLFLGFGINFLVLPSIAWLHGADYEQSWFEAGRIRMDIFIRLQWMHVIFLGALSAAYFAIAPRYSAPVTVGLSNRALPSPWPWIAFGLIPLTFTVAERLVSTGSLAASQNYGDIWFRESAQLNATYREGGGALAATQVLGKVWFVPWQALGIGEGLLLARLIRERRRLAILLFALQVPILTLLNTGGRSVIAIPFIAALLVADLFAGPIRWRWLPLLAFAGLSFFNLFGVYRAYRDRDFSEAVSITSERYETGERRGSSSAEGDIMVIKEHYGVAWVDANNYERGPGYFSESILGLLPQQIVPEKVSYMNTASFLSMELLGPVALSGAGVAGAIIVDGYMIGRELGVLVLALVLGMLAGGSVRLLSRGRARDGGQPRLWQTVVLLSTPALGVTFYRNNLAAVLSQTLTTLLVPALLFALLVAFSPKSPWGQPIGDR